MKKYIVPIVAASVVLLLLLTLSVIIIFNRTEIIQCNNIDYRVIQDIENPYFLVRESHPNINELKTGSILYYEDKLGITEELHIRNTEKYGNITFIPNSTLSSADFYNLKTCFSNSSFEYERNIVRRILTPASSEISGEICKDIQLNSSNSLLFSNCSKQELR